MSQVIEQMKRIERLFLENAEALLEEEIEPEDLAAYRVLEGAGPGRLSAMCMTRILSITSRRI